ncbi:Uncharacterised protein [Mycobacteroides abscessus subsp. abscessus]|nr:Uncharacterised protein [Mycobacteroides abscessus subsp. abscessus]
MAMFASPTEKIIDTNWSTMPMPRKISPVPHWRRREPWTLSSRKKGVRRVSPART